MSALDDKVEQGADKLEELVEAGSRAGGVKAKLAEQFAGDPAFLRKLKPSLIAARAKRGGPNPFVVIGAALVAGVVLAHVVDWLGHRHPRD